jgi:hypothetical protein
LPLKKIKVEEMTIFHMHEITKEIANEYIRNRTEKDSYLQNKEGARYEVNLPSNEEKSAESKV